MRVSWVTARNFARRGFTVLELLLAVSIMTVIIIGLYTVFDQTQKALRGTMSQVDVLEGVRSATDLISSELEGVNYLPVNRYTNFYVARNPLSATVPVAGLSGSGAPVLETVIQDLFFHARVGDEWKAIGYWVGPLRTNLPPPFSVGRLYRYAVNYSREQVRGLAGPGLTDAQRNAALTAFNTDRMPNSSPVMDGIVHFKFIAYAPNGFPMYPADANPTDSSSTTFLDLLENAYTDSGASVDRYFAAWIETGPGQSMRYNFSDRSFPTHPSALEVEIGVLEPDVIRQYISIAEAQPAEAARFLARQGGKIHLFRQRIPLRNAPPY
jgi:prepilin-type N-terminal cleavage/methylation domain-containing protein